MEELWIHSLLACMPQILDDFLIFCSLDNQQTCCRSVGPLDFVNLRDMIQVLVIGIGLGTRMLLSSCTELDHARQVEVYKNSNLHRLRQRFLHGGKEYVATVKMGTATNTQD